MKLTRTGLSCLAVAVALAPLPADAGGLARPNPISARGIGMGGAFVAVADDPTALHFNPAGMALLPKSAVLVGGEFIVAPRTYTPDLESTLCTNNPDSEACDPQSPSAPVRPLPVLGYVSRLKDEGVPSRMSFGVGLWNTYGGQLEYDRFTDQNIGALNETRNAVIEVVPGVAYEVNDVLAIGLAFRLGYGLFDVNTTARPSTANLSATGFGAGGTVGAMVRASKTLQFGAVYRTSLTNQLTGDGTLTTSAATIPVDVKLSQRWPQSAGAGFQWKATPKLRVMGELDWTNWSRLNTLVVEFPGNENMNQTFILDWNDSIAVHAGAELAATDALTVRAGYTYDTPAVPDHTIERQFLDSHKHLAAVGASWQFSPSWRVDTAFERTIPFGARVIEDNSDELGGWSNGANVSPANRANPAPGEHEGTLNTFELAVQYLY
jgi:long-chain fatty acid transport protein